MTSIMMNSPADELYVAAEPTKKSSFNWNLKPKQSPLAPLNGFQFCMNITGNDVKLTLEADILVHILTINRFGKGNKFVIDSERSLKRADRTMQENNDFIYIVNDDSALNEVNKTINVNDLALAVPGDMTGLRLYPKRPIIITEDLSKNVLVYVVTKHTDASKNSYYIIDCTNILPSLQTTQDINTGGTHKRRASKKERKAKTPKRRKHTKKS